MVKNVPQKLYKFQSFKSEHSIENLRHSQIWFSKPAGLNDPFDCATPINFIGINNEKKMAKFFENYYFKNLRKSGNIEEISKLKRQHFPNGKPDQEILNRADELVREFSQQQDEKYSHTGVACFTTEIKNILMWSHYADGHRGFCLEFDTKYFPSSSKLIKVIYSSSYPTFSPEDFFKAPLKLGEPLYTKSKDWEHEEEWRLIMKKGNSSFEYNAKALTAIYFGCWALKENIDKITTLPAKSAPHLYQMKRSKTEFKLEYESYHP